MENSFESPDSINAIDWNLKTKNKAVFNYIRNLVYLRKQHSSFRMKTSKEITDNIRFLDNLPKGVVAFAINGMALRDNVKRILVCINGTGEPMDIIPMKNSWVPMIENNCSGRCEPNPDKILLPYSISIYYHTYN